MADAQWYEAMAAAMKKRERCLTGIVRWQNELAEAEAEIEALRDSDTVVDDPDVRLATAVDDWKAQQAQQEPQHAAPEPSI